MARARLIAVSKPFAGEPRRLAILAIKVSQGKLHEREPEYYLTKYSDEHAREYLLDATRYPSVYEHIVFTFLVEGISRVASHQLVRHRIASYTQESQRYSKGYAEKCVEMAKQLLREKYRAPIELASNSEVIDWLLTLAFDNDIEHVAEQCFVIPPSTSRSIRLVLARNYLHALARYYELLENGVSPEDARYVLPQSIKTRILVTMNLRELIHVACLRLSPKAQWEIREVVRQMIEEASKVVSEIHDIIDRVCIEKWSQ